MDVYFYFYKIWKPFEINIFLTIFTLYSMRFSHVIKMFLEISFLMRIEFLFLKGNATFWTRKSQYTISNNFFFSFFQKARPSLSGLSLSS